MLIIFVYEYIILNIQRNALLFSKFKLLLLNYYDIIYQISPLN